MDTTLLRIIAILALLVLSGFESARADGPAEFPPPGGKGRVVLVSSGISGPDHYVTVSRAIAALGYDVVLVDGNEEEGTHGEALRAAIAQAQTMPHALPGKVALVGFSLGGGESLYYGTPLADSVAGVIAWYPANAFIKNVIGFAQRLAVPVVVFAGGKDHFRNDCCTALKDGALADAAKDASKPFDLSVYPDADHDFVKGGKNYNASDYDDAFARTAAALKADFAAN